MKKAYLLLLPFLLPFCAAAQVGVSIGATGGLNIPKLSAFGDNPMSKGYKSKLAGHAGVFAEIHFSDLFSLQPKVEYTQLGGRRNGMQAIPAEMLPAELTSLQAGFGLEYLYADFKSKTSFDYLMIPVLAKLGWDLGKRSPFRVHVGIGPFVSFLLSAKQVTEGRSYLYVDAGGDMTLDYLVNTLVSNQIQIGEKDMSVDRDIKDEVRSTNYGIAGNLGLSYSIAERHSVFLEGGANYGLVKLQKDAKNGENRIGAATVTLGYAYRIK